MMLRTDPTQDALAENIATLMETGKPLDVAVEEALEVFRCMQKAQKTEDGERTGD